jgi:oligoribonuclease NrnB/cAMP/cGMP phosphodiesterase (DHH superfamily)|tara:strand:+ start:99 stop:968 length:870 start_codon:yes stop_codon:yes gene_type:complete
VNILIYTDNDLDGAGSALLLKWYFKQAKDIVVVETGESILASNFKSRENTHDHFDKIFILDLALTKDIIPYIDKEKVVVIDHHADHYDLKEYYKNAKAIIIPGSSCVELISKIFSKKLNLTEAQQTLIDHIDSYDSFNFKCKEPLKLNAIFNCYNRPKVEKFIEAFYDGFREYTLFEKNSINLHFKKLKEQINQAEIYKGKIKDYDVVATFADYAINEVARYFINKHKAEIGIVVNKKAKVVSFRRAKQSKIDVSILAKTLCDGGGSVAAAGGKLTEKFGELTKQFKLC